MLAEARARRSIHVHCRTGYPDRLLALKLPGAYIYGCDPSPHAIELAQREGGDDAGDGAATYKLRRRHASARRFRRGGVLARASRFTRSPRRTSAPPPQELARLLAPRGQALVAMPLRGSFVEIADLLREYALKNESTKRARTRRSRVLSSPDRRAPRRRARRSGLRVRRRRSANEHAQVQQRPRLLRRPGHAASPPAGVPQ